MGRPMALPIIRFASHGTCHGSAHGIFFVPQDFPWESLWDVVRAMGRAMGQPMGRYSCHMTCYGSAHGTGFVPRDVPWDCLWNAYRAMGRAMGRPMGDTRPIRRSIGCIFLSWVRPWDVQGISPRGVTRAHRTFYESARGTFCMRRVRP